MRFRRTAPRVRMHLSHTSHPCNHMSISAAKSILMGKRALSVVDEASDSSASDEDDDKLPNTTSSSSSAAGTASGDGFDSVSNERQHKRKQKKEDKKLKKSVEAGRGTRADFVNVYGAAARPELIAKWDDMAKRDQRLSAWDFQALVLWCLADVVQPRWMFVKNKPLLEKILIVSVDGLAPSTFRLVPSLRGIGSAPPAGDATHLSAASAAVAAAAQPSASSSSSSSTEWPLAMPLSDPDATRRASHALCCGAVPGLDAFAPASLHVPGSLFHDTSYIKTYLAVETRRLEDKVSKRERKNAQSAQAAALVAAAAQAKAEAASASDDLGQAVPREEASASSAAAAVAESQFDAAAAFCLSELELAHNKFPVCGADGAPAAGFVQTVPPSPPSSSSSAPPRGPPQLFGIDCEMCRTAAGLELTRVTVVDESMRVVFESLVRPDNAITDYCTQWSGITEESLRHVRTRLEDVQRALLAIVSSRCVLVGHSLENDLMALRLVHGRVLDTSILFPHPRGPPYRSALKYLAKKYLDRTIQTGEHDSAEDARTALMLALLKIKRGASFGIVNGDSASGHGGHGGGGGGETESLLTTLARHRRATAVIAAPELLRAIAPPSASAVACASDDEAVRRARAELANRNDLVWVCLSEFGAAVNAAVVPRLAELSTAATATASAASASALAAVALSSSSSSSPSAAAHASGALASSSSSPLASSSALCLPPPHPAARAAVAHAALELQRRLALLEAACPPNAIIVVIGGPALNCVVRRLHERKLECVRHNPQHRNASSSAAVSSSSSSSNSSSVASSAAVPAASSASPSSVEVDSAAYRWSEADEAVLARGSEAIAQGMLWTRIKQ